MHDDFYQMYLEEMNAIPPCTKEEEAGLLAAAGADEAKKRLVEGNLKLALECAREFDGKGVLLTDLVQEANMALVLAVDNFSRELVKYGVTGNISGQQLEGFNGYIQGMMRDALRAVIEEEQSAEQTGEELAARVNVLQTVSQMLAKELGREASVEELAERMKMTVEEINSIMKMAIDAMSMNAENTDMEALAGIDGLEITEEEE